MMCSISFPFSTTFPLLAVPIIPDYLFSRDANASHLERVSLSPVQKKFEALERDNGPLGVLLASKAFVQLVFTPLIGYLTEVVGYNVPLLLGSCNMFIAAICK